MNDLAAGVFSTHRLIEGSPAAADAAVSASVPDRRAFLNAKNSGKVLLGVELTGGTTPSVNLELYAYDEDQDSLYLLETKSSLSSGATWVFDPYRCRVWVRVASVSGNPTEILLRVSEASPLLV